MRKRKTLILSALVIGALVLFANTQAWSQSVWLLEADGICTSGSPEQTNGYRLSIIGWQSLSMTPGAQAALQVQYTKDGAPVSGATITFLVVGNSADSQLLRTTGLTNAAGVAESMVQSGQTATRTGERTSRGG